MMGRGVMSLYVCLSLLFLCLLFVMSLLTSCQVITVQQHMLGFVEELVVATDPEFEWRDQFRQARYGRVGAPLRCLVCRTQSSDPSMPHQVISDVYHGGRYGRGPSPVSYRVWSTRSSGV
jgi:cytochrome c-type biogenesis protein CcmH/NrfF